MAAPFARVKTRAPLPFALKPFERNSKLYLSSSRLVIHRSPLHAIFTRVITGGGGKIAARSPRMEGLRYILEQ